MALQIQRPETLRLVEELRRVRPGVLVEVLEHAVNP